MIDRDSKGIPIIETLNPPEKSNYERVKLLCKANGIEDKEEIQKQYLRWYPKREPRKTRGTDRGKTASAG